MSTDKEHSEHGAVTLRPGSATLYVTTEVATTISSSTNTAFEAISAEFSKRIGEAASAVSDSEEPKASSN
jgi:hypothetical protein